VGENLTRQRLVISYPPGERIVHDPRLEVAGADAASEDAPKLAL
jgi:hypothetical protein